MLAAPVIVQETYVNQIISIAQNVTNVLGNVPDALAGLIPRVLLVSSSAVDVAAINQKVWTSDQVRNPQHLVLWFSSILLQVLQTTQKRDLSVPVLQGFSCSSLQSVSTQKVKDLIKSCRPRSNRNKVQLKETQLTCMYNYVKGDASQNFGDFPSDMLLYYKYVNPNCRSYFTSTGVSDFSVLSSVLNIPSAMLSNAKDCLGITGNAISKDNLNILGNMACTLDYSHIVNSDPFILEKLKNCNSFTADQVAAMETVLLSGNTMYGNPSNWSSGTLTDLGVLPLYLTQNFWNEFTMVRCTLGNITHATISYEYFPFGYNAQQFDLCLDVGVVTANLAALTEKIYTEDLQAIILAKLNEAYPSGLQDAQLQLLGATSRVATTDDISQWNISKIDTLSAFLKFPSCISFQSKAIIMRYLNAPGTTLGSTEINAIGPNICSLDTTVLNTITSDSLKMSNTVDLSSCSSEQKSLLYNTAILSYRTLRASSVSYYLLIVPYLGEDTHTCREAIHFFFVLQCSVDYALFYWRDFSFAINIEFL
uniref:Mesothelin-like protein n=1 Tax=Denticeps clupeoides TaxID=299321 RepID=A0AAY4B601_9TELE